MSQAERIAALKGVPVLAMLSEPALEQVAGICKWHQRNAEEELVSYADPSTDVFFLTAGSARVVFYSPGGKAVVFVDLKAGAMFGELAAIDRAPRSASVVALERCTIASLTAQEFEGLLAREPSVALAALRHLTAEVRRLTERVLEFSTLAVQNRIHAELLRLGTEARLPEGGEALLTPAPSLADIANRISTHREAVSRELTRLASLGVLRRVRNGLRITDMERLERMVREAKRE
jgi:CRP-like cAMP-binding protein